MEFFISKRKIIKGVLLGLLMTAVSALMFYAYPNWFGIIFGALGLAIFGTMSAFILLRFFESEPQVVISSQGIEDKRLNFGLIEWDEIKSVALNETKYARWLNICVETPEKYYCRLPKLQIFLRKANGQTGMNDFRVRFNDLDKPVEEAFEMIEDILETRYNGLPLTP